MGIYYLLALAILVYYGSMPYRNQIRAYPHFPIKVSSIVVISQTANEEWCEKLANLIKDDLIRNLHLALNYEIFLMAENNRRQNRDQMVPDLINWQLQNLPKISPRTYRVIATHHLDDGEGYFTFEFISHRGKTVSNEQSVRSCFLSGGSYDAIQELINKIHHAQLP